MLLMSLSLFCITRMTRCVAYLVLKPWFAGNLFNRERVEAGGGAQRSRFERTTSFVCSFSYVKSLPSLFYPV